MMMISLKDKIWQRHGGARKKSGDLWSHYDSSSKTMSVCTTFNVNPSNNYPHTLCSLNEHHHCPINHRFIYHTWWSKCFFSGKSALLRKNTKYQAMGIVATSGNQFVSFITKQNLYQYQPWTRHINQTYSTTCSLSWSSFINSFRLWILGSAWTIFLIYYSIFVLHPQMFPFLFYTAVVMLRVLVLVGPQCSCVLVAVLCPCCVEKMCT